MNVSMKGLILGFGALICVLLLSGLLDYQNTRELRSASAGVARTHEVIEALQAVLATVTDAETGQRGYIITRDRHYLEPYLAAAAQAQRDLERVGRLTRDEAGQLARFESLKGLVAAKLAELERTLALQEADPAAARRLIETHLGRSIMDSIRAQAAAMSREERALLAERERASGLRYLIATASGVFTALLGLALLVQIARLLRRHLAERGRFERDLERQRQWLQVTLRSIGDAVIATDTAGAVTFLNPVAEKLTGWKAEEAAGQPLETVFDLVNEETGAVAPNPAERVLREGVVVGLANHTALVAKDGGAVPIEDSAAPIRDGAGDVAGVVLVFREVIGKRAAETSLRQSEQRFRTLMELAPDAIWVNRDERIELVNSEGLRLLGAERAEQVAGRSPLELFHPDCHDKVRARLAAVRAGQSVHASEETIVRLDGNLRQVEVASALFVDAQGPAVQVVLRDITRRRQRDRELDKLNRALRALSKSNQALMRSEALEESAYLAEICDIITQDCGHAMVWIGFKEDDPERSIRPVAWAGFEDGYLESLRLTWADAERGRGATGSAIRTGKPSMCLDTLTDPNFAPWRAEAMRRGYRSSLSLPLFSGGNVFGAITFYSRETAAFGAGEVALLEELTFDLACGINANRLRLEHARAEETLRESERRFRAAFEQGVIPMALTALDGRIMKVNPSFARLLGYTVTELQALDISSITWPDDIAGSLAGVARMSRGEAPSFRMEKRYLRKDGRVLWADMGAAVVPDALGRPAYLVTHIQDVTERKRAEEGLREANRRKDEFLATLAHELRNPLVPIRTGAFLLGQRAVQDPETRSLHDMIARQSAHMARLVDDLLDVSRIEQGRLELRRERVDPGLVAAHAVEACQALIDAAGLRLTLALPGTPPALDADPVRLEQMLCNLLSNACKCTPRGGSIRLAIDLEGSEVVLRVQDDGIGMTPEVLANVFDLFYQGGRSGDGGGLGIGLTLVRRLAQLHDGSVLASSAGPGRGSEFTLRLPAAQGPAPDQAPERAPEQVVDGAAHGRRHVLIVDDDPSVRTTLEMLLKALDYQVTMAATGAKGVERAVALRPDIALIDLGMPGMGGLEVACRIRAELGPAIHLVALTGFSGESDFAQTKAAGFDQHVVKSGDPRELLARLREVD